MRSLAALVLSFPPLFLPAASPNLDRFGGDPRLKSRSHNAGVTFWGASAAVGMHELTDRAARFPTDGRLAGKLLNPNVNRPESAAMPERWFRIVSNTASTIRTDPADGDLRQYARAGDPYHITGVFTLEKIANHWWFIDPEGNVFFPRSVAVTDMVELYARSHPSFEGYDAVYLEPRGGEFSPNLREQAHDPLPGDVVDRRGVTVREEGDAIYLGSLKPFNVSYFLLHRPGAGGLVEWYYSSSRTPAGWALLNDNGHPAEAVAGNADGSYNLDAGGYLAAGPTGELEDHDPRANRIRWWNLGWTAQLGTDGLFPADFAPRTIGPDRKPRYYLKGVVTRAFSTAPVLSQVYDAPSPTDLVSIKYAAPGTNPAFNWFRATNERFRRWGWNGAGQYSTQYTFIDGNFPADRLPVEPTTPLSTIAMEARSPWHIKNIYEGVECPPGSGKLRYKGHSVDAFEPGYKNAIETIAARSLTSNPWTLFLVPEEGDDVFGINSLRHDHLGYAVVSQNPYKPLADGVKVSDPKFYAKYALRDFLRERYKPAADALPPLTIASSIPAYSYAARPAGAERQALENLNATWGTKYTTWDTSSGRVEDGTNAWGSGAGFLDENGAGVMTDRCNLGFQEFGKPGYPKMREDLDAFLGFYTRRYGSILYPAVKAHTANLMALTLYQPPDVTAAAISPYTDLIWTNQDEVSEIQRIYRQFRKPLMAADYSTTAHDGPQDFGGAITSVSYDAERRTTRVSWTGRPYKFRRAWNAEFPDLACKDLAPQVKIKRIDWYAIEVAGNYAQRGCVAAGQRVWLAGRARARVTQADRASFMEKKFQAFLDTVGPDGVHFVSGFEHWCYMDRALIDPYEFGGAGLVTALDNAYDGVEARRAVGRDSQGRFVGGEDGDYGDLLGPLSRFLHRIYDQLIGSGRK